MSTFPEHSVDTASGEAKELLETINGAYGFVPNLFSYMAEAPATLKAYLQLNSLLEETSFTGAQLQVALLAVSIENSCEFCRAAHVAISKKHQSNPQSISALQNKQVIEDEKDRIIVDTVLAIVPAGFTHKHYLELVLVVTIKTLSNYINHQTQPQVNPELQAS